MARKEGNIVINSEDYTEEFKKRLKESPFKMQGVLVEVIEAEGDSLKEFFSKHGNHYQTCLQRQSNEHSSFLAIFLRTPRDIRPIEL
jgi:hypothetical protein